MASFGQLNASATSFRAETTNALVNNNLEINIFSRRYISPPSEYAGVGQHLAPYRLREAQDGIRHGVARKLGLLFKDRAILPATPELIKAYGSRASEVSKTSAANPRGNDSHGAFAELIGADATTLWAAATSGWTAIQCHLLACLLARIWEPPEATAIWVGIVAKRKELLKLKLAEEGELDQEILLAAAEDMPRTDLREWDASARAWLRVADSVMMKQQTQLRLIIDNLDLPVNQKPDAYESVIEAWTSAMTQMEKLLCGMPLQVVRGDILLGLLSWHLYPDMKYLSSQVQEIKQHDPLLEGRGILTVGLEPSPRIAQDRGSVYWSLPLSHLRYYNRLPVTKTRSIRTTDLDRLTVDELLWAVVSCYILPWDDGSVPTADVLQFVSDVAIELHHGCGFEEQPDGKRDSQTVQSSWAGKGCLRNSWLTLLSRVCLQNKDRLAEERTRKLRAMGQRFCPIFRSPFQNIFTLQTYLTAGSDVEGKIKLLREKAASFTDSKTQSSGYQFLITYPHESLYTTARSTIHLLVAEYATVRPEFDLDDPRGERGPKSHRRWLPITPGPGDKDPELEKAIESRLSELRDRNEEGRWIGNNRLFRRHYARRRMSDRRDSTGVTVEVYNSANASRSKVRDRPYRSLFSDEEDYITLEGGDGSSQSTSVYTVLYGHFNHVALLVRRDKRTGRQPLVVHDRDATINANNPTPCRLGYPTDCTSGHAPGPQLSIREVMSLFQPGQTDWGCCARQLRLDGYSNASLLALTFIETLYHSMNDATIDVRAVKADYNNVLWADAVIKGLNSFCKDASVLHDVEKPIACLSPSDAGTAACFACISMMETGTYDLNPTELESVFAICAADSLYISSALLRDPVGSLEPPLIQRFVGNIGKSGMALLVPPKEPEVRNYDHIDEWYQYDHVEYNGKMENCFQGTSLHISFSEASQSVNVSFSGGIDVEAYFLETLISVYDKKDWIAELDVLGAMKSARLNRTFLDARTCDCRTQPAKDTPKVISIDNFAEIIVPPRQPGIVRARGNWQARLALATLCSAKGYMVLLKPEKTCWACFARESRRGVSVMDIARRSKELVIIL
ncbi:hypothetical protein F4780DRAFT_627483 [Xylariomycetidae sp. FL0641]|nr:hypothetical protein F4780DRAFT_627483 [Xylariomycetidae sp. FL0641]